MRNLGTNAFGEENSPHWEIAGGRYFVTFRLAGSLPASVLAEIKERSAGVLSGETLVEKRNYAGEDSGATGIFAATSVDAVLDAATCGPFHLRRPEIARLVIQTLQYHVNERYRLFAFAIMPNHVHLLLQPLLKEDGAVWGLDEIIGGIKRYSAREANKILGIHGPFWQREYYDHRIRDIDEFAELKEYIHRNPVRAGLCTEPEEWPWSSAFCSAGVLSGE